MRSSTASETLARVRSSNPESFDSARITVAGQVEEAAQPRDHRAARGILIGIFLGAGAWGAIWFFASTLWHHHG